MVQRPSNKQVECLLAHFQNLGFLGGNIWFGTGSGNHHANNSVSTYTKAFLDYQYGLDVVDHITLSKVVSQSTTPVRCGWDIEHKQHAKGSIDYEFAAFALDENNRRNAIIFPIKTHGLPGNSGISVISEMNRETFDAELEQKGQHLQHCATAAHIYMQVLRRKEPREDTPTRLTAREQECLLWLSRGYGNKAIAEKMKVSETRVNQLLRQARERLNANTCAEALSKAIIRGEISP